MIKRERGGRLPNAVATLCGPEAVNGGIVEVSLAQLLHLGVTGVGRGARSRRRRRRRGLPVPYVQSLMIS